MPRTSWKQAMQGLTPQQRGQVIPETKATFQVTGAKAGESKSGKEFIEYTVVVLDTEYAGAEITDAKYYSPQSKVAERIWWENLAALGVTDEWIENDDPTTDQIAMSTIGVQFKGRITVDEWNGRKRNKFDIWDYVGRDGEEADDSDAAGSTGLEEFEPEPENPDAEDALPDEGPEKTPPVPEPVAEDQQQVLVTSSGEAADDDPWATDDDS